MFICVENKFRSQVAEALFNARALEGWAGVSAGLSPASEVHPNAVLLLRERGIDISGKTPSKLTEEIEADASLAVTVCDASECPVVRTPYVESWGIPDPSLATLEEARKIVSLIEARVDDLVSRIVEGKVPQVHVSSDQFKISPRDTLDH